MSFKKEESKNIHLLTNDDKSTLNDSMINERSNTYEKMTELITLEDIPDKGEDKILSEDTFQNILIDKNTSNIPDHKLLKSRRKGNMYMCWYDKNDSPRICIGPQCIIINNTI